MDENDDHWGEAPPIEDPVCDRCGGEEEIEILEQLGGLCTHCVAQLS